VSVSRIGRAFRDRGIGCALVVVVGAGAFGAGPP
jgi:hypothetical protein